MTTRDSHASAEKRPVAPRRSRLDQGFSLSEMLVVVALLGIFAMVGLGGMQEYRRRANVVGAARSVQAYMLRARMLSVYRGTPHFVVIDEAERQVRLVVDSHTDTEGHGGVYCVEDRVLAHVGWEVGVVMKLPNNAASVDDPLDSGALTITNAWTLPDVETADPSAYVSGNRGLTTTTFGKVNDASDDPNVVVTGVGVFTDNTGQAAAVAIRGDMGMASLYYMPPGSSTWNKL